MFRTGKRTVEAWDEPAMGLGRYMGRKQSVAALARLLRNGSSVSILGGAKIGKTSLVSQVALELGQVECDLFAKAAKRAPVDQKDTLAAKVLQPDHSPGQIR